MDRVKIKAHARQQIKGKILTIFAMTLIVSVASSLIGILFAPAAAIALLLVAGPIELSLAMVYLAIVKKGIAPKIEDLLLGFQNNNFTRAFVGYLRYEIFVFLWSLLFFVPGIIKSISYSQMFYLMAEDKKLDAGAAQAKSMAMMEGHKGEYFIFMLSFIPWYLLVGVTFGIASIYVTPYINAARAEYFVRLKKGAGK